MEDSRIKMRITAIEETQSETTDDVRVEAALTATEVVPRTPHNDSKFLFYMPRKDVVDFLKVCVGDYLLFDQNAMEFFVVSSLNLIATGSNAEVLSKIEFVKRDSQEA